MSAVAVPVRTPELTVSPELDRVAVATQWQLMWWRFRKHKLALVSGVVLGMFYLVVLFADFMAYSDPLASEAQRGLIPPQSIMFFEDGHWNPSVAKLVGARDPVSFKRVYVVDPEQRVPVR